PRALTRSRPSALLTVPRHTRATPLPYTTLFRSSPLVDAGGRSVLLRATVANPDARLRPGMFARVQLLFGTDQVLAVPEAALAPSDRKSTRLNPSHVKSSYAVFCLKKKTGSACPA